MLNFTFDPIKIVALKPTAQIIFEKFWEVGCTYPNTSCIHLFVNLELIMKKLFFEFLIQ